MTGTETCTRCGARLVVGESGPSCPKCLLAEGLRDSGPGDGASAGVPTPEELSHHFPNLEILELIGQGGMGIVYKAKQVGLDREVALKILPPGIASGPSFADRFSREAKTMARLDHPNIVRVYEFGEADELYYLVMEFVDGLNLRQLMEAGGVEPREALSIIPQICDALQFAHDRGIVHRDVKPENVLLDRDGRVRITDFGLAKLLDPTKTEHRITGTGQVMGTVHYMAPEQYRTPEDVDHRADIFSLGVVFYELLTGELPLGRFALPSANVQVDVRLDEVVLRALEKEPKLRYQRVVELKTEVDSIHSHPAPAVPPRDDERRDDEVKPRLSKLALFGFLCSPAALLLPVLAAVVANLTGLGASIILVVLPSSILVPVGFVLSLLGWVSIVRSNSTLRGLPLAIVGTFAPGLLVFVMLGVSVMYLTVREPMEELPAPVEATQHFGRPELEPELNHSHGLLWLMNALEKTDEADVIIQVAAGEFYAPTDAARLKLLDAATRDRLGEEGILGLPLLHAAPGDLYVDMYRQFQTVTPAMREGFIVTGTYGSRTLVFDLVNDGDAVKFALSPVSTDGEEGKELILTGDGARAAARVFLGIWRNLWSLDGPPRGRIPAHLLPHLFAPSRQARLNEIGVPSLNINGASGRYGLLFMDPESLPGNSKNYEVSTVALSDDRTTALIQATDGNSGSLQFSLMFEDGRWWVTPGKVE